MRWFALISLVLAGLFVGCQKDSPTPTPVAPAQHSLPTHAQPKLRTVRLWLGPEEMTAEVALTAEQEETGMMFRTNMEENAGMLFVFGSPMRASFWMKNTILPLSAAYIDPDGNIAEIHDLKPQDTNPVLADSNNIQYVLEVNQGWFARHHIPVGTLIRSEYGTLRETFIKQ